VQGICQWKTEYGRYHVRPDVHSFIMDLEDTRTAPKIRISRFPVGALDPEVVLTPVLQVMPLDKSIPEVLLVSLHILQVFRIARVGQGLVLPCARAGHSLSSLEV
jgi:hypothetical protein